MIFIRLVAAVIGEKTVRQTVRRAVLDDAVTTPAVIYTARFRTHTLFYFLALHFLSSSLSF